jgi:holo-[acyl-carrier protein] synthase
MIHGIGIDIVKNERIRRAAETWGKRFLSRIFTESELAYCYRRRDPYPSLAARFAAKEAFVKAMGGRASLRWTDIEISNDRAGKPTVHPHNTLIRLLAEYSLQQVHISMSHEKEYSIACVVIERAAERPEARAAV